MADAVGPDVSVWQKQTPPLGGQDFIIVRTAYGDAVDPIAPMHIKAGRDAGLVVGGYLFARDQDPGDQVRAFLQLARPLDFWAVDHEDDRGHPSSVKHPQVRAIIRKLQTLDRRVLQYATPSTVFEAGQDGDWLAAPGQRPLDQPWRFRQHQSGVAGGNQYNGTRADLEDWLGMKRLIITDPKVRIIGLRQGIMVHDLTGQPAHALASARDERVNMQVTVGPDGPKYYVIPSALGGDPAVALVRVSDVQDKGAPAPGGASDAEVAAAHAAGFAEARDKAVAAVQAI